MFFFLLISRSTPLCQIKEANRLLLTITAYFKHGDGMDCGLNAHHSEADGTQQSSKKMKQLEGTQLKPQFIQTNVHNRRLGDMVDSLWLLDQSVVCVAGSISHFQSPSNNLL